MLNCVSTFSVLKLSVDEKPSIQAIERASGYVETDSYKVVRALKSTYKRQGTLNVFAALEVETGQVHMKFTEYKKREDFLGFLDGVLADQPLDPDQSWLPRACTKDYLPGAQRVLYRGQRSDVPGWVVFQDDEICLESCGDPSHLL